MRKQKVTRITVGNHSRERCWDVGEAEKVKLVHKGEWMGRRGGGIQATHNYNCTP